MKTRNKFKSLAITLSIFILFLTLSIKNFQPNITSWDTLGYYLYLPAKFIFNDLGLKNIQPAQDMMNKYELSATFYQVVPHENGNHIIKYSSGLALLFAPLFFITHFLVQFTNFPADGFSLPYQIAVFVTSLIFLLLGLVYLRKLLNLIFQEKITILILITLFLGTNLFSIFTFHTSIHLYLFALYAILLWNVVLWHNKPSKIRAVFIGLIIGLLTIIRPTELISLIIPVFYGIYNLKSLKIKYDLVRQNSWHILLALIAGLIAVLPQLLYWKYTTGNLFFYSYVNPGEGFDFHSPHIINVLFSFRKGWLIYTPIMIFALIGFYHLHRYYKEFFYPVLFFTLINIYIVSSWSCWWYAGSFSQRALSQSYVILALPLGAFFHYILTKIKAVKTIAFIMFFLLIVLNLFQHWQYKVGIIDDMRMTKPYYFAVFGRTKPVTEAEKRLLLVERSLTAVEQFNNRDLYFLKNTVIIEASDTLLPAIDNINKYKILNQNDLFTPAYYLNFNEITNADHVFFVITAMVYPIHSITENPFSLVATFEHKSQPYKYRATDSETLAKTLKLNEWNTIEMIYLTPEVRSVYDRFAIYYWLRGSKDLIVGPIKIEIFEPKRGW